MQSHIASNHYTSDYTDYTDFNQRGGAWEISCSSGQVEDYPGRTLLAVSLAGHHETLLCLLFGLVQVSLWVWLKHRAHRKSGDSWEAVIDLAPILHTCTEMHHEVCCLCVCVCVCVCVTPTQTVGQKQRVCKWHQLSCSALFFLITWLIWYKHLPVGVAVNIFRFQALSQLHRWIDSCSFYKMINLYPTMANLQHFYSEMPNNNNFPFVSTQWVWTTSPTPFNLILLQCIFGWTAGMGPAPAVREWVSESVSEGGLVRLPLLLPCQN